VLGVERSATVEDIKRKFRELAKMYHPDLNKAPDAATRMAQLSTAYDCLLDPSKRLKVDNGQHTSTSGSSNSFAWSEFSNIFAQMKRSKSLHQIKGADISTILEIPLERAYTGGTEQVSLQVKDPCSACEGTGSKSRTLTRCIPCQGSGVTRQNQGILAIGIPCLNCGGSGLRIERPCIECHGQGIRNIKRQLKVHIPKGIRNFNEIRMPGQGHCGTRGGSRGDLYVTVKIQDHPTCKLVNDDIHTSAYLTLKQAFAGGETSIRSIRGEVIILHIDSNTLPGTSKLLRGRGFPKTDGSYGDLIINFFLKVTSELTAEQIHLIEKFDLLESSK
jgi:molecular chaperone DnaJ